MTPVKLTWAGGEHRFCLRMGELRGLQKSRDAGPEEILTRLRMGRWHVDDMVQVLRWGLIGAGEMDADAAGPFVTELVDLHPLSQFKLTAIAVLIHAMFGDGDGTEKKPEGGAADPLENGTSPTSTETAP
ncbi:gene transfer agent family protein [uncultured Mameliella sp.]|uniref:gene transfer agent family protein n=1 Tax=uncultured Mameliella sp. TaxID=1447087 RepID=UPI00261EE517|nr:gene transfer agent family protein [uncultured Mameliella sp.]